MRSVITTSVACVLLRTIYTACEVHETVLPSRTCLPVESLTVTVFFENKTVILLSHSCGTEMRGIAISSVLNLCAFRAAMGRARRSR